MREEPREAGRGDGGTKCKQGLWIDGNVCHHRASHHFSFKRLIHSPSKQYLTVFAPAVFLYLLTCLNVYDTLSCKAKGGSPFWIQMSKSAPDGTA